MLPDFRHTPTIEPMAQDLRALGPAEHLMVLGFRAMALGMGDCVRLRAIYAGLLSGEADDALAQMHGLVRFVGVEGRRRIRVHPPGCCGLTPDERLILAVLAAAQSSLHHDEAALRGALDGLLGGAPSESCILAAQAVAAALLLSGYELPQRREAPAPGAADPVATPAHMILPEGATLH